MAKHRSQESWTENFANAAFSASPDSVFDVLLKSPSIVREEPSAHSDDTSDSKKSLCDLSNEINEEPLARSDNTINSNKVLLALPNELLLNIGDHLSRASLNSLAQTCQRMHAVCNPPLYRKNDHRVSHWAAAHGRIDTAGRVIEYTKDAEGKYHFNSILLPRAAARGHEDLVTFLISKGADVNQPDSAGQTALEQAMSGAHVKMSTFLSQQEGIDLSDDTNDTDMFQAAITNGHYAIADRLLQCRAYRDAHINTRFTYGLTPLGTAVECGVDEILKLLISHGADINQDIGCGMTALEKAIESNNSDAIILLLQQKARLNRQNK
ncbi:hypothetical protein NQ176_g1246 [Zarea fungicola]|uniref:Uncharacterized protein n=1 Tax=Zarea fungicola TaxID=93591 RepID=A0ACC1NVY4_9HYPO|nr:hypothetical protein NQ176_g1246 [Lecanicillium fungicola]